jgi:hypothetical protein
MPSDTIAAMPLPGEPPAQALTARRRHWIPARRGETFVPDDPALWLAV